MKFIDVLRRADSHFSEIVAEQPQNLQCRRGCTACCSGLFEIGAADVAVIGAGLATLDDTSRRQVIERAERLLAEIAQPNLREATAAEKEAFFARTDEIPCPALDESGACLIYEHRPLVCRTFGLPLREGSRFLGEECELNFTAAASGEKERAAWDLLWEDELGPEDQFTVPEAIVLAARLSR